jgi:hypothetical protein
MLWEELGVACIMHEMEEKYVQGFRKKTWWKENLIMKV